MKDLKERRSRVLPECRSAAIAYAALHDTPQRLMAVGAVRDLVSWKHSRRYFSRRLYSRRVEMAVVDSLAIWKSKSLSFLSEIDESLRCLTMKSLWLDIHRRILRSSSDTRDGCISSSHIPLLDIIALRIASGHRSPEEVADLSVDVDQSHSAMEFIDSLSSLRSLFFSRFP